MRGCSCVVGFFLRWIFGESVGCFGVRKVEVDSRYPRHGSGFGSVYEKWFYCWFGLEWIFVILEDWLDLSGLSLYSLCYYRSCFMTSIVTRDSLIMFSLGNLVGGNE